MKILVTGASGFIGSNLTVALANVGHHVYTLSRRPLTLTNPKIHPLRADMRDREALLRYTKGMDIVYHLAAATSEKASTDQQSHQVNVDGMQNLIDALNVNKVKRLIVVSTQSTKRQKRGHYGETKKLADEKVTASTLNYTILKPTLVYGPGAKGLFAKIIKLIDTLPIIPVIGSGNYKMQPIYIDDLVRALVTIAGNPKTYRKTYDLAGGTRLSFNETLREIMLVSQQKKKVIHVPFTLTYAGIKGLSLLTKNPPVTTDNLLGLVQETTIDLKPAQTDFHFKAFSFKEGITKTIWGNPDKNKKRIGIVGLGKMGLLHGSIINYLPNASVAALFDVNPKLRRQLYSLNIKAPYYTNVQRFFAEGKLDGVIISVPPAFTLPTIREAAKHNVHFLVEKPLSDSLEHAREIVDIVRKHKLKASVGYMYGYMPIVEKVEQLLQQGVLGTIKSYHGTAYVTQVLAPKKGWRYDKKTAGGGCVSLHGTHLLYLTYRLFGIPNKVKSTLEFPYSQVEDKAEIKCHYSGPIEGKVNVSWSEKGYPKLALRLDIIGTNGALTLEEDAITLNLKKAIKGFDTKGFNNGLTRIERSDLAYSDFELGGEGYYEQDRAFVNALHGKKERLVTVDDGYAIQRLLASIYDSHNQKKEVSP